MTETDLSLPTEASVMGLTAPDGLAGAAFGEVGETPGMTNGSETSLDKER